jgi:hypothetical protein
VWGSEQGLTEVTGLRAQDPEPCHVAVSLVGDQLSRLAWGSGTQRYIWHSLDDPTSSIGPAPMHVAKKQKLRGFGCFDTIEKCSIVYSFMVRNG